eukprot:gene17546-23870_t
MQAWFLLLRAQVEKSRREPAPQRKTRAMERAEKGSQRGATHKETLATQEVLELELTPAQKIFWSVRLDACRGMLMALLHRSTELAESAKRINDRVPDRRSPRASPSPGN